MTPRYDLYAPIHKALRHFMHDTLVRVGDMDLDDPADLADGLGRLDELLAFLRSHVRHENDYVHPAIEARQPAGSGRIGGEHVEHLEAIAELSHDAAAVRAAMPGARPALAHRLYHRLALFVAENLVHMHVEETAHNQSLWAHYTDDELHGVHGRLVAHVSEQDQATTLRWMAASLRPQELLPVLQGIRHAAPAQAFQGVLGLVRSVVPAARFAALERGLALEGVAGVAA